MDTVRSLNEARVKRILTVKAATEKFAPLQRGIAGSRLQMEGNTEVILDEQWRILTLKGSTESIEQLAQAFKRALYECGGKLIAPDHATVRAETTDSSPVTFVDMDKNLYVAIQSLGNNDASLRVLAKSDLLEAAREHYNTQTRKI